MNALVDLSAVHASAGPSAAGGAATHVSDAELIASITKLVDKELDAFWDDKLRINVEACPLQWWRDTGSGRYGYIAPVARGFFSCVTSSAQVERVFSKAKFWSRDEKGKISDHHLDICTCVSWELLNDADALSRVFDDCPFTAATSHPVLAPKIA